MSADSIIKRIEKMQSMADPSSDKMRQALTRIGTVLQAEMRINIGRQKLIDTGNLLNSIKYYVLQTRESAKLDVGSYGVPYAAVHEFGFRGSVSVPAHQRFMKKAFGRNMKNPREVDISAHIRRVDIPSRPYVKPALIKHRQFIIDLIRSVGQ